MLVRAKKLCFIGDRRRKPGEVFEWDGDLGSCLEAADGKSAPQNAPVTEFTDGVNMPDDEIRVRLAEYGIRTHPATSREKLVAKLKEAEGK